MDSKNPMRAGVLELGEQIKQKFSREDTKCPTREPVSREHSEGKKKNVRKYEKILMFQKNFWIFAYHNFKTNRYVIQST